MQRYSLPLDNKALVIMDVKETLIIYKRAKMMIRLSLYKVKMNYLQIKGRKTMTTNRAYLFLKLADR